ncbi:MAG: sulfite exporter TauE/SafE family protein [Sphingomicrobium sp.]
MDANLVVAIAVLMGLAAMLYSMVGHGGASAYLAIMALFALAPDVMRPTALALNLVAAGIASIRYARAGQVNWRLLALFVVVAAPAAFVAGKISLPPDIYRPMVGVLLWIAAIRLFWSPKATAARTPSPPSAMVAVPVGAALGFLAGLTGTGGGIFLSPLIILLGWEEPRRTSGIAALFILINSAAGLAGNVASVGKLPAELPWFGLAVAIGALLGSWLGSRKLDKARLLQGLGLVLVIAGAKLIVV